MHSPAPGAAPRPWTSRPCGAAGAALLLLLALATAPLADTHAGFSPRSHYWPKDQLRSQPGKPPPGHGPAGAAKDSPPPPPPPPGAAAARVPYPANATSAGVVVAAAPEYHRVAAALNGSARGRQLLPLLADDAAAALAGDYLLGYSHNPWGPSSALRDVLGHLGAPVAREEPRGGRSRRSVLHLYNMLVCSTGCDPMAYKGYGCYCGFLGSGYTVDGIDRCCKMHDWCYDTASCPMFLEYFVPYLWKCYRGRPLCAVNGSACSQRLCECDRRLAECLRHYPCPRRKAVCTSSPWRLLQNLFML